MHKLRAGQGGIVSFHVTKILPDEPASDILHFVSLPELLPTRPWTYTSLEYSIV